MAPIGVHRPCIVCGKSSKDKKAKPLADQDNFWNQHADEIKADSKVPLKEFLTYFGISLDSVVTFAKAGDVDQVLADMVVCMDCNDWVLYGAFLKEKYLRVDRVLRDKLRDAFIHSRFQSRIKSDVGAVAERIRQCLMPCCVLVDKIAVLDESIGTAPSSSSSILQTGANPPPAKRSRTRASAEEPLVSGNLEVNACSVLEDELDDFDNHGGNSGADDTAMDYDDTFDDAEALDGANEVGTSDIQQFNSEENMTEVTLSKSSKCVKKVKVQSLAIDRRPGPKSRTEAKKDTKTNVVNRRKLIIFKECPICQEDVSNYIQHMILDHHVQPHHILLNNFWCRGCKIAYQPPDPQTPTGQYRPEHHDVFLQFVQMHSECRYSTDVEPHPCRFCDAVHRHKTRPSYECIQHEAKLHTDNFGADYSLAVKAVEARNMENALKNEREQKRRREKVLEQYRSSASPAAAAVTKGSQRVYREGSAIHDEIQVDGRTFASFKVVPIRKTCPICATVQEDYRTHMVEHNLKAHPIFLDFVYCRSCKQTYEPPDPDSPTGKYLPKDHEYFLEFFNKHKQCRLREHPPHSCRYCYKILPQTNHTPGSYIDHEIRIHADKVGEYAKLLNDNSKYRKHISSFKTKPGDCPVCQVQVNAYGIHMISEHNVLPHWTYTNYFICRCCKMPYQPADPQKPLGKYQPEDHDSFLEFVSDHSSCFKERKRPPIKCRFCDENLDSQSEPFYPILHQISKHGDLIGEFRLEGKAARRNPAVPKKKSVTNHAGQGNGPESPVILLNELKNEISFEEDNRTEDPLMMNDQMDNFEDADYIQEETEAANSVTANDVPPEILRGQEDLPTSEALGLELDASGVRRSTRARKPTMKMATASEPSSDDEGNEYLDGSNSEDEPSIIDLHSSEESEISERSEGEFEDPDAGISKKKDSKKTKKARSLNKPVTNKLPPSSDDDEDEPEDGSVKLGCVVCDAQRSQPKLSKHYKVEHNLIIPYEGYFACRGCQHAFLSPNENIPTGKFVSEDIEYLKEFVSDHDGCKRLHVEKSLLKLPEPTQLHFCRYCFKKYHSRSAMKHCIMHEMEVHKEVGDEPNSATDVPRTAFTFYCVYCKIRTNSLQDVYMHMRSHRKPHRFGCCKCDSQFKDVRELTYHIRLHGTSNVVFDSCVICDAYMDAPSIVGHYQQHHGLEMVNYKYFGCWHCEEAFVSEQPERSSGTVFGDDLENLNNFVVRHENCKVTRQHPAKEQKCRKCPSSFTTMKQLVEHEEIKHPETQFGSDRCTTCGRTFLSDEGLAKHKTLHLSEEYGFRGEVPFYDCPDCFFSCPLFNEGAFDHHLLQHKPDKLVKDEKLQRLARSQFYKDRDRSLPIIAICVCDICGSTKDSRTIVTHYHKNHNIGLACNQIYCLGCKEPFRNEADGAPYQMERPTDEIKHQFKSFAAAHSNCQECPDKPIECVRCLINCSNIRKFLDHFSRCHTRRRKGRAPPFPVLQCLRCGQTFQSIVQLRDHLKEKVQAWECNGCKQQFMAKENYAAHSCSAGAVKPEPEITSDTPPYLTFRTGGLNCLTCVKAFDTITEFNLHFKCFHNNADKEVKFECSVCHEVQTSTADPESEDFPRICADHETKCKAKAREGSKKCEDFSWPQLTCFICEETFESIQKYSGHLNEHSGHSVNDFCPVCPAVFTETEELRNHVTLHGLKELRDYQSHYICRFQGCLWISNRPEVESGRLVPEDLGEFQVFAESHENCTRPRLTALNCKFCDQICQAMTVLFNHEAVHTKRWQVYCDECGRGFASKPRLKNHLRSHEEKLKFACTLCPRKFRWRSYFEHHMNTHTGEKPFVCDQCGKSFTMGMRLREHVRGVHNKPTEKTSPCTWGCDRMFATRREARVHELKAHNRPLETRRRNQFRDFGE